VDNIGSHNPQRQINRMKSDEINFKKSLKVTWVSIDKMKLTGKGAGEQLIYLFYENINTVSHYNQNYSHKAAWKKLRANF